MVYKKYVKRGEGIFGKRNLAIVMFMGLLVLSIYFFGSFALEETLDVADAVAESRLRFEAGMEIVQYSAVVGEPVRWRMEFVADRSDEFALKLPKDSENIVLRRVDTGEDFTGMVDIGEEFFGKEVGVRLRREDFVGSAIRAGESGKYELVYETPAPEIEVVQEGMKTRLKITSPEDVHYENVLSFAEIPEILKVGEEDRLKLYQTKHNGEAKLRGINLDVYDSDGDGFLDRVEWVTPMLSEWEGYIVIEISKAERLSADRSVVLGDIYDSVKALDGVWSGAIGDGGYVRVTFEEALDNRKDITVYPRVVSGDPKIEVYEKDSSVKLAEFVDLHEGKNTIYLTELIGRQDVFDLRVVGGVVEFDWIVDPVVVSEIFFDDFSDDVEWTNWIETGAGKWLIIGVDLAARATGSGGPSTYEISLLELDLTNPNIDVDLSGQTDCNLTFWSRFNKDGGEEVNLSLDIYSNGIWQEAVWVQNYNGAVQNEIDLDGNYTSDFNIRFKAYLNNNNDLAFIDNINITCYQYLPDVDVPTTYDNITLEEKTEFKRNDELFVNVSVTHGGGADEINTTLITILNPSGGVEVDNATMNKGDAITDGYVYDYSWTIPNIPESGEWVINVYSNDTSGDWSSNGSSFNVIDTVIPAVWFEDSTSNGIITVDEIFVNVTATDVGFGGSNISTFIDFDNSLVSWWTMDLINGTGDPTDRMGRNNGTKVNGANWTADGYMGDGFSFDGDDDYINTGYEPVIEAGETFAISTWFKADTVTVGAVDALYYAVGDLLPWRSVIRFEFNDIWCDFGEMFIQMRASTAGSTAVDSVCSSGTYNDNNWHHGIVNYDGTDVSMYFDGVLDGTTPITSISSGVKNFTGYPASIGASFNGTIDDVMWFNRSLSEAEIAGLYANSSSKYLEVNYTGLAAGDYTFKAYAQDTAGNVNETLVRVVEIDLEIEDITPPHINFTDITPPNESTVTDDNFTIGVNASDVDFGDNNVSVFIDFNNSLVGWWRMDDSNATGIYDNSSYGNFGAFQGAGFGEGNIGEGKMGKGLEFDGAGDYVDLEDSPKINLMNVYSRSYSGWINSYNNTGRHVVYEEGGGSNGLNIYIYNNRLYAGFWAGGTLTTNNWISVSFTDTNDFHSFVVSLDFINGVQKLYLDGVEVNSSSETGYVSSHTGDINLGYADANNIYHDGTIGAGNYFNGSIDDVMIFNRALSPVEIVGLYANQSAKILTQEFIDLVDGNYTFKAYAQDSAGNVNDSLEERTVTVELGEELTCGSTITTDTTLGTNMNCPGTAITIGEDNITLDCAGFTINYSTAGAESTYGIYSNRFNSTIKNCNVVNGNFTSPNIYRYGIVLSYANFSNVVDNNVNISGNLSYGIYLWASPNNTLINNTGISNSVSGILLSSSSNNTLINNTGVGETAGILFSSSSNNTLINNTGMSTSIYGIAFYTLSENNLLINNTGVGETAGILFSSSSNNTLISNKGEGNSEVDGKGIWLFASSNNTLINNVAISPYLGTQIHDSDNNNIFGMNSTGGDESSEYALFIYNSTGNNIQDCIYLNATIDVYVGTDDARQMSNEILNCTYDTETVVGSGNSLTRKWYYLVSIISGGSPVDLANLSAYNVTGDWQFNLTSGLSGYTNETDIIEYVNTGGVVSFYSNYTINVTAPGDLSYSGELNVTSEVGLIIPGLIVHDIDIEVLDLIKPYINFTSITPLNESTVTDDNFTVGVNASDVDLGDNNVSVFIDFNNSLVGWWRMDDYNSTGIYDNSSYENFGVFGGGLGENDVVDGKMGKAMEFDGVGDFINISYDDSLNITSEITLSAWIRSYSDSRYILAKDPPMNSMTVSQSPANEKLEKLKINKISPTKYKFKSLDGNIVEIGSERHSLPMPYLKISKWDGEVSLKVNVPYVREDEPEVFENNTVVWSNDDYDVKFYPKEPEEIVEIDSKGNERKFKINEEGGVEFDLVLKEKPLTNVFEYELESENLDYFYQPALNEERQREGVVCSEIECVDEDGIIVNYRPENVVGSYAVYHKTKMNNEYKTGKAFHIYRPLVWDAEGEEIWGDLFIDEEAGILSVTVDEEWLDGAVYPVNIDPGFGYSDMGATDCPSPADMLIGSEATSPSDSGMKGDQMCGYAYSDNSIFNAKLAIYENSDGGTAITNGITDAVSIGEGWDWYCAEFNTPPDIASDTTYLLPHIGDGNDIHWACDSSVFVVNERQDWTNSYASPEALNWDGSTDYYHSVYVNYTVAGGGAGKTDMPYALNTRNGGEFLVINNSVSYNVTADGDINDGEWHHISATYNGSEMRLYIDGILNVTSTAYSGDLPNNNLDLWLGANYSDASSANFNGTMDDVMIFDRALSDVEIAGLYANTSERYLEVNFTELALGNYTFKAYAQDTAGNVNVTEEREVEVILEIEDVIPPSINFTSITPPNESTVTDDNFTIGVNASDVDLGDNNVSVFIDFNNSLVGWWRMDDSNATGVYDNSSYENFGNFSSGMSETNVVDGRMGKGLKFDGVGDYVSIGDSSNLEPTEELSLSVWIYKNSLDIVSYSGIVSKDITGSLGHYALVFDDTSSDVLRFGFYTGSANEVDTQIGIPQNQWTHIVATWKDSTNTLAIYMDGVLKESNSTITAIMTPNDNPLIIGSRNAGPNYKFNGSIDDVMIFDRALSAEEIVGLYANQSAKILEQEFIDLVDGNYTFKAYAQDSAGNVNVTEREVAVVSDIFPPYINFTEPPTPVDGYTTTNTSVEVRINITNADDLNIFKWNWNGTNYTSYDDSLLLMINFDNVSSLGENNTNVVDLSKNKNNLDVSGAVVNTTDCVYGNCYSFNGNGDYIESNSYNYVFGSEITLAAWFKYNGLGTGSPRILEISRDGSAESHTLAPDGATAGAATLRAWAECSDDNRVGDVLDSNTYDDGEWHYMVYTYSSPNAILYVDGNQTATGSGGCADLDDGSYLIIGAVADDSGAWAHTDHEFDGNIDEVRVWNRSLSAEEIYEYYVSNLNKYDTDKWLFYINQSKNATDGLFDGNYTYQGCARDVAGNWNCTEERGVEVNTTGPTAFSIAFSSELANMVNWTFDLLPAINQPAEKNNGAGATDFWINVSTGGGLIDLYVRGTDLMTDGDDVLGIGNETISFNKTDSTVPADTKNALTNNYADTPIGSDLGEGDTVFLKFFLNAQAGQAPGVYNNTLDFKAVLAGLDP